MLWVRPSAYLFHLATDTHCRRVARFVFERSTVNLLQLGIVHIHAKGFFYCRQVCFVSVCRNLHSPLNPASSILHKIHRPICAASTHKVRNDQFCVGVNSHPHPNVTPADFLFLGANIFCLRADICPYLIALQTAHADVADVLVVKLHARRSEIDQEFGNRIASDTRHPRSGTDAVPFN